MQQSYVCHTSEIKGLRSEKVSRIATYLYKSQFICRLWKYDSFFYNCYGRKWLGGYGQNYNQIWEDGLYVPGYISEVIAVIAK